MLTALEKVLIYSVVGFAFLFVIAKILGKKQIAQLDFLDYTIGISLGSIAADMAFDIERPIWYYLVGMAVFAVLDLLCSVLGRKNNFFKRVFVGKPLVLIEEGRLNYRNLNKSKLSLNEFLSLCREKGYFNLDDVAYCIFETSGKLSVLPKAGREAATALDVGARPKAPAALSKDVVMDGRVIDACLAQLGKDEAWLRSKLGGVDVKDVAIAYYLAETDEVVVHPKHLPQNDG
ncbi:MAG: DUF421 domain-containing protein [Clostridia bacterium]|nr:DUF421 domain-containing protein [Clostridia bacterium]